MVFSGLSTVSDVGFKKNKSWGSEIGTEHLETPWKYSASAKEWPNWGGVISGFCAAFLPIVYRSIASVLVRVFALVQWKPLRGCGSCVLIWRAHRNDNMSFVSQALCPCTCVWELQSEKHLRITQPAFHIRASQPPSMWNVHSQNSSWNLTLELHFWLSFSYRSGCCCCWGQRPRNRNCTYQRETFPCFVWLAPYDYRLAGNDFHNCGFAASAGIQLKGSNKTISEQKVSATFQWQGQQKTYLSGRFPSVPPCTDLIDSRSWVEGFCYRSIRKGLSKSIST